MNNNRCKWNNIKLQWQRYTQSINLKKKITGKIMNNNCSIKWRLIKYSRSSSLNRRTNIMWCSSILSRLVKLCPNRIQRNSRLIIMINNQARMITRSLLLKYTRSRRMTRNRSKTLSNSKVTIRLPSLKYTPNRRRMMILNRSRISKLAIRLRSLKYTRSSSPRRQRRITEIMATWSRYQR